MMVGGLVRIYVNRRTTQEVAGQRGILFAAGLIGGDACLGILVALLTVVGIIPSDAPGILPGWVSLLAFVVLGCGLAYFVTKKSGPTSS